MPPNLKILCIKAQLNSLEEILCFFSLFLFFLSIRQTHTTSSECNQEQEGEMYSKPTMFIQ